MNFKQVILLLLLLVSFGCAKETENTISKEFKVNLNFGHNPISNKEIILEKISNLLHKDQNSSLIRENFFKDSWAYAFHSKKRGFNRIEVEVKEHKPFARWNSNGFLTHSGHLIFPKKTSFEMDLISLKGPEEFKLNMIDYTRQIQAQLNRFESTLEELKLEEEGFMSAKTTSGTRLIFNQEGFRDQLERLESFISFELVSGRLDDIRSIDFRYSNAISVHFI